MPESLRSNAPPLPCFRASFVCGASQPYSPLILLTARFAGHRGLQRRRKEHHFELAVRLYDPDEGEILLGGQDIRTLKLRDIRQAMSVLFQDYTHFPLSVSSSALLCQPSAAII